MNARFLDAMEGWKTAIQCSCEMLGGEVEQEEETEDVKESRVLNDIVTFLLREHESSSELEHIQAVLEDLKAAFIKRAPEVYSNRLEANWVLRKEEQNEMETEPNAFTEEGESQFDQEMKASFEVLRGGSMEYVGHLRHVDIVDVYCSISLVAYLTNTGDLYLSYRNKQGEFSEPVLNQFLCIRRTLQNSRIQMVALGASHCLILLDSGFVYSFGNNSYGQLGVSGPSTDAPQLIASLLESRIIYIAAGYNHSLAIDEFGNVYAWGSNGDGECGVGDGSGSIIPTPTRVLTSCRSVAAGESFSLFVTVEGEMLACGRSGDGQCGAFDGETLRTPRLVSGFPPNTILKKVSCGESFSVALDQNGNV